MTTPTVDEICLAIQDVVSAVSGIRMAPDIPLETVPISDVTGFCYPYTGTYEEITNGRMESNHTIHLWLLTPRRNLRSDHARVKDLGDLVARALLVTRTLAGNVILIDPLRYTFGPAPEWGGQDLIGWSFEIQVKAIGALT